MDLETIALNFKRSFFSKLAGVHFFFKKYFSFSEIALLDLETIALNFKRSFFSKLAGAHFFFKKYFSFSEIALLVLETIAQILSRNSATQHFSQKKNLTKT